MILDDIMKMYDRARAQGHVTDEVYRVSTDFFTASHVHFENEEIDGISREDIVERFPILSLFETEQSFRDWADPAIGKLVDEELGRISGSSVKEKRTFRKNNRKLLNQLGQEDLFKLPFTETPFSSNSLLARLGGRMSRLRFYFPSGREIQGFVRYIPTKREQNEEVAQRDLAHLLSEEILRTEYTQGREDIFLALHGESVLNDLISDEPLQAREGAIDALEKLARVTTHLTREYNNYQVGLNYNPKAQRAIEIAQDNKYDGARAQRAFVENFITRAYCTSKKIDYSELSREEKNAYISEVKKNKVVKDLINVYRDTVCKEIDNATHFVNHGDLNPGNVIFTKNRGWQLHDFSFDYGLLQYDLFSLLETIGISEGEKDTLVSKFYHNMLKPNCHEQGIRAPTWEQFSHGYEIARVAKGLSKSSWLWSPRGDAATARKERNEYLARSRESISTLKKNARRGMKRKYNRLDQLIQKFNSDILGEEFDTSISLDEDSHIATGHHLHTSFLQQDMFQVEREKSIQAERSFDTRLVTPNGGTAIVDTEELSNEEKRYRRLYEHFKRGYERSQNNPTLWERLNGISRTKVKPYSPELHQYLDMLVKREESKWWDILKVRHTFGALYGLTDAKKDTVGSTMLRVGVGAIVAGATGVIASGYDMAPESIQPLFNHASKYLLDVGIWSTLMNGFLQAIKNPSKLTSAVMNTSLVLGMAGIEYQAHQNHKPKVEDVRWVRALPLVNKPEIAKKDEGSEIPKPVTETKSVAIEETKYTPNKEAVNKRSLRLLGSVGKEYAVSLSSVHPFVGMLVSEYTKKERRWHGVIDWKDPFTKKHVDLDKILLQDFITKSDPSIVQSISRYGKTGVEMNKWMKRIDSDALHRILRKSGIEQQIFETCSEIKCLSPELILAMYVVGNNPKDAQYSALIKGDHLTFRQRIINGREEYSVFNNKGHLDFRIKELNTMLEQREVGRGLGFRYAIPSLFFASKNITKEMAEEYGFNIGHNTKKHDLPRIGKQDLFKLHNLYPPEKPHEQVAIVLAHYHVLRMAHQREQNIREQRKDEKYEGNFSHSVDDVSYRFIKQSFGCPDDSSNESVLCRNLRDTGSSEQCQTKYSNFADDFGLVIGDDNNVLMPGTYENIHLHGALPDEGSINYYIRNEWNSFLFDSDASQIHIPINAKPGTYILSFSATDKEGCEINFTTNMLVTNKVPKSYN